MNYIIISAAFPLLAGLLYFEKKESVTGLLSVKPLLSSLFVLSALMQTHNNTTYFNLILAGLVLCLAGDICLIFFFNRKIFTAGLASFLAGHIMYAIAFFKYGGTGSVMLAAWASFTLLSITIFMQLKSRLGNMKGPVLAYIIIITVMAAGAASLWSNATHNISGRNLVLIGALLFYVSDIFVARHRFVKKEFFNRAAGLPMYYSAQFMIAFSTGLI